MSEAYVEPSQACMVECFAKTVNGFRKNTPYSLSRC